MPVPILITDLSTTAASNYPAGTDSPSTLDDVQRAHASFIAQIRDGAVAITHNTADVAVTQASGDSSTKLASTAFVQANYANGVGGSAFTLRNKLINGAMGFDQLHLGAAQTITAAAALAYTADRWYGYCTGANVTGQVVAGTAPNRFNYRFTGAASVTKIGFAQRIEYANCQDLAGTTATFAVDLANSLLTTVTWVAYYATSTDAFGTLASPTRTQIATGTFTVNSTLTRYSTQITIPSAATTGIEIELSVAAQTSGTWTIGRAQFEQGSVATPFEYRLSPHELAACQYYLRPIVAGTGFANGTTTVDCGLTWPTMRSTPTLLAGTLALTAYGNGGAFLQSAVSSSLPNGVGPSGGMVRFNNFTGLVANAVYSLAHTVPTSAVAQFLVSEL